MPATLSAMTSLAEQNQTCTRAVQQFHTELPHKPQNSPYSIILESESHNSTWVMGVKHYSWKKPHNEKYPPQPDSSGNKLHTRGTRETAMLPLHRNKHGFVFLAQFMSQCTCTCLCAGERENAQTLARRKLLTIN